MKIMFRNKLMFISAVCFALACFTDARTQDIIASSACYFKTPTLSVSWTIGEIATETFANEDIILTQGFNQANITITDVTEDLFTDINIIVYPNPVKDVFTIKTGSENIMHLKAELYNLSGTKLLSEQIDAGSTPINIERFPESRYILKIYDDLKEIKTFKVLKTN